jgi:hypothetical protein
MAKLIPLHGKHGKGQFATVDDEMYDDLAAHKWYVRVKKCGGRYIHTTINGKPVYMHSFILEAPKGMCVDHKDRDTFNNTRTNLRIASYAENCMNRPSKRNTTSLYKGVSLDPSGRWRATVTLNGKLNYLGTYTDEICAALAYNRKARELFGEFAYQNPIPNEYHDVEPMRYQNARRRIV